MLIAIPSENPGGLEAAISDHFGHCAAFTIVEVNDGKIGRVDIVPNGGHEQGGCMAPVKFLKERNVNALLSGGMGMRPLAGFQSVGITVYHKGNASTVNDAVTRFMDGKCPEFGKNHTCGGGGGCGGHHHHHEVERPAIEGVADVRDGRIVSMEFELKDAEGNLIDASDKRGPMRYLQGSGAIVGLERALVGKEAGAEVSVDLTPEDGFGERDENRVVDVRRDQVPGDVSVGEVVTAQDPSGSPVHLRVIEVNKDSVKLDGNHPLSGKTLHFDLKVVKVEAATEEEIAHGHIH